MARTVRNAKIDSRSARAKLSARREPYWTVITRGCALGYRRGAKGGTWIARYYNADAEKKMRYQAIGPADDALDDDSPAALSFAQAQEKARAWFAETARDAVGNGGSAGPYTVADAMRDYLAWYAAHRKALMPTTKAAETHILPSLGGIELSKLTTSTIRQWHEGLAASPARVRSGRGKPANYRAGPQDAESRRRRQATANRVLTVMKAALNHAWHEGKVAGDEAWRRVRPFRDADAAKVRYLSADECTRLVNACEPDFRKLVQAALLTGCRYGELTAMQCGDFNADAGIVSVRNSKSGKPRHVPLNDEGVAFINRVAVGRASDETMFLRADGKPWGMSHQRRRLEDAAKAAKITDASFHILRHTYGSALAMQDVPMGVIATALGHADTRMTEKHYAALAPSYVAETIRANLPPLGIVEDSKVTRLKPEDRTPVAAPTFTYGHPTRVRLQRFEPKGFIRLAEALMLAGKHLYAGDWGGEETSTAVINFSAAQHQTEIDTYIIGWMIARQREARGTGWWHRVARRQRAAGASATGNERVTADARIVGANVEWETAVQFICELRHHNEIRKADGHLQRIWEGAGGQFNEELDDMNAAEVAFRESRRPTINAHARFNCAASWLRQALCGTPPDHDDAVPTVVIAPDGHMEPTDPRLWAAPNATDFIKAVIEAGERSLNTTLGARAIRGHVCVQEIPLKEAVTDGHESNLAGPASDSGDNDMPAEPALSGSGSPGLSEISTSSEKPEEF